MDKNVGVTSATWVTWHLAGPII